MSINKFGIQLVKGDTRRGGAQWNDTCGIFRNYVRENSLCVEGEVFDAKSRKIRRLANSEADSDAVNKLHLDHRFKTINERPSLAHSTIGHVAIAHRAIRHIKLRTVRLDTLQLRTVCLHTFRLRTVQLDTVAFRHNIYFCIICNICV